MEKISKTMKNLLVSCLFVILLILLFPVAVLWLIVGVPIEYFCYIRSAFYKNEHIKYEMLCTFDADYKLYNELVANRVPIRYFADRRRGRAGSGWFYFKDILILQNDCYFHYDAEEQQWCWRVDELDPPIIQMLDEDPEQDIMAFNTVAGENICNKAVWLTNEKDVQDYLEEARKEPLFLLYDDSRLEALKRFCQENG